MQNNSSPKYFATKPCHIPITSYSKLLEMRDFCQSHSSNLWLTIMSHNEIAWVYYTFPESLESCEYFSFCVLYP